MVLSIYPIYPHIHLSFLSVFFLSYSLSFYLPIFLWFYGFIPLSLYLCPSQSIYPTIYRSTYLSICLSIYMSVYQSIYSLSIAQDFTV